MRWCRFFAPLARKGTAANPASLLVNKKPRLTGALGGYSVFHYQALSSGGMRSTCPG
jgi:hypothetical protein